MDFRNQRQKVILRNGLVSATVDFFRGNCVIVTIPHPRGKPRIKTYGGEGDPLAHTVITVGRKEYDKCDPNSRRISRMEGTPSK
jgi:hypothetical protein